MQWDFLRKKETKQGGVSEETVEKVVQVEKKKKKKTRQKGNINQKSSGTLGSTDSTKTHTLAHPSHMAKI